MSAPAEIAREIKERDNFTCRRCGANKRRGGNTKLHVHHIVEPECGGTDDPSNLITLCSSCHGWEHHERARRREEEGRRAGPFAYTLAAAARYLEVAPETIKRDIMMCNLEEVYGVVGRVRLVTAETVERYAKQRKEEA